MSGGTVCKHFHLDPCVECIAEGKASETYRRLSRYDEAIRLLEECEKVDTDAWAMILTRKVRAFLAAEPADKETT